MDQLTGMGQAGDCEHGEQPPRKGCGGCGGQQAEHEPEVQPSRCFLLRGWREDGAGLYTALHIGRMRDNKHELKQGRFRQDKRRNIFQPEWSAWVTPRQGCRLPREAVQSVPLELSRSKWEKHWATWSDSQLTLQQEAGPETSSWFSAT